MWKGKKASKAERQAAMARALVSLPAHFKPVPCSAELLNFFPAPLSSLTYCSKQDESKLSLNKLAKEWILFSSSICFYFPELIGVYQSQKLPDHNKCGDSE